MVKSQQDFFCGLEKSNTISKTVQKIIKDEGSEITFLILKSQDFQLKNQKAMKEELQ